MSKKLRETLRLLWRGLFLEPTAYDEAAADDNPFVEGVFLVIVIGIVAGLGLLIGGLLAWATMPDLGQIKATILEGLRSMAWYDAFRSDPEVVRRFEQNYELGWRIGELLAPSPTQAFLMLLVTPLRLLLSWLWFGLVAHGVARLLGGNGTIGQTLGAAALAAAPQLLLVLSLVPGLAVAGIGTWTLLARYVAVRRVHENLPWPHVLVAVLTPTVLLILVGLIAGLVSFPLLAGLLGGLFV
jgi:hypothetical protein